MGTSSYPEKKICKPEYFGNEALVFGFDIGSKSIGLTIRDGQEILFSGTLVTHILGEDTLESRRTHRRQRRRRRNRQQRLNWFLRQMKDIGFSMPEEPGSNKPIIWRYRALEGKKLTREQITASLYHLAKRRGKYPSVPWGAGHSSGINSEDEEDGPRMSVSETDDKMEAKEYNYPAQLLYDWKQDGEPTRNVVFNTHKVASEFSEIIEQHSKKFPELAEKKELLLYGDREHDDHDVRDGIHVWYDKNPDAPGLFALKWPQFENRSVALDQYELLDDRGRPQYVCKKDTEIYRRYHREEKLFRLRNDFGVIDEETGEILKGENFPEEIINAFRGAWPVTKGDAPGKRELNGVARQFGYELRSEFGGTKPDNEGRANFSRPTLKKFIEKHKNNERVDPQPKIKPDHCGEQEAVEQILSSINDPLVEHRLRQLDDLLQQAVAYCGHKPDAIVVELPRGIREDEQGSLDPWKDEDTLLEYLPEEVVCGSLPVDQKEWKNLENDWWDLNPRKRNGAAREFLTKIGMDPEKIRSDHLRMVTMLAETQFECVYCGGVISPSDILKGGLEIDHIVPQSRVADDSYTNTVVVHTDCNQAKGGRTPHEWFESEAPIQPHAGISPQTFDQYKKRCSSLFKDQNEVKFKILIAEQPEEILESRRPGARTGFINRYFRYITLLRLGWHQNGRDPVDQPDHPGQRYMTTDGALTARLRRYWGFGKVPHELYSEIDNPRELYDYDARNHAVDAAVVSATLPWYHYRGEKRGGAGHYNGEGDYQIDNPSDITANKILDKITGGKVEIHHVAYGGSSMSIHEEKLYTKRTLENGDGEVDVFLRKKPLDEMKYNKLNDVYPVKLGKYLQLALDKYNEKNDRSDKSNPIKGFVRDTYWSNYQSWRHPDTDTEVKLLSDLPIQPENPDHIQSIREIFKRGSTTDMVCVDEQNNVFKIYDQFKSYLVIKNEDGDRRIGRVARDGTVIEPAGETETVEYRLKKGSILKLKEMPAGRASNPVPAGLYRFTGISNTIAASDLAGGEHPLGERYGMNKNPGRIQRNVLDYIEAVNPKRGLFDQS